MNSKLLLFGTLLVAWDLGCAQDARDEERVPAGTAQASAPSAPAAQNGETNADESPDGAAAGAAAAEPAPPEPPPEQASPEAAAPDDETVAEELSDEVAREIDTAEPAPPGPPPAEPLRLLGETVPPGEARQLSWRAGQTFAGSALDTPVLIVHGEQPGPILCLTAAIHGDELNGVEIVRRVMHDLDPEDLQGTVIGVPIVNLLGFTRGSRYLPDRRDLNRYFPGNAYGSSASRIAHLFFEQVVKNCQRLVDIHTGSLKRANLPQLRADLHNPDVLAFTEYFGATAVLHDRGGLGTLRRAASDFRIPTVTLELGEPNTLQTHHVRFGVKAIETLLDKLDMVSRFRLWSEPQPVYYASHWVRADHGGILITKTRLGALVDPGDLMGTVVNPLTNEEYEMRAPWEGRILGMALNQFVLPGFAAFHIGIVAPEPEQMEDPEPQAGVETEMPSDDTVDYDETSPEDGGIDDEPEYH